MRLAAIAFTSAALFVGCHSSGTNVPRPKPVPDAWSETIKGNSGRLRLELEDLDPGLRYAITLELRNRSVTPIAVINRPPILAELFDAAGAPVPTAGIAASGPIPAPQWAVIPRDAHLGFRVDEQTFGVPTRQHGKVLVALNGRAWTLPIGDYVLEATVVFTNDEGGPADRWVGELKLPALAVTVTPQMVAVH